MKITSYILLLFSVIFFSSKLNAQCTVNITNVFDYNGFDISCNGAADAAIAAEGSGGTGPYTYQWNDALNSTVDTLFNLHAGYYRVTMTDNVGCTAIDSIYVNDSPLLTAAIPASSNASCFGACDGGANVLVTGGAPNFYTYSWSNGSISNINNSLCAGTHTITVTDANGCTASADVIIQEPTEIVATMINVIDPSTPMATDGSASVTASGGAAPYAFFWSDGQTTPNASGLAAGTYCVTVADANNCSDVVCATLIGGDYTLEGVVRLDTNNNCFPDTTEQLMSSQIIKSTDNATGAIRYFTTDQNGLYRADLAPGNYTLEYFPINSLYSSLCVSTLNITIASTTSKDTVNWALETGTPCHFMDVSISAPFLRMTGNGSDYVVYYCNNGNIAAPNSYVEVEIDSFLTVLNTSMPVASQVGNLYTFNLDTVDAGECGYIFINVLVNGNAVLGQTHCTEAHIYP